MVGSFTKTNAFIGRRFKTPMGQRETSWDILSQKTSNASLIHADSQVVSWDGTNSLTEPVSGHRLSSWHPACTDRMRILDLG
jgi:hypothetical protein